MDDVFNIPEEKESPEDLLRANIEKANEILNIAMSNISAGLATPRMLEVAAKLVDSVTNAAEKLIGAGFDLESLLLKERLIKLKEKELMLKSNTDGVPKTLNQNIIVSSREDLLKLFQSKKGNENDE
ncbi:MAG: hypothetical protein WC503_00660 [Candidatus Shapirobacteria bacterium]